MSYMIAILGLTTALMWAMLITDHRNVADLTCPVHAAMIRYPDGWREASCKPTGINWGH